MGESVLSLSARRSSFVQYITPFPRPSSDLLFSLFLIHHTLPPTLILHSHHQPCSTWQDCPGPLLLSTQRRPYVFPLIAIALLICCCALVCSFLTTPTTGSAQINQTLVETWTLEARLITNKGIRPNNSPVYFNMENDSSMAFYGIHTQEH